MKTDGLICFLSSQGRNRLACQPAPTPDGVA
jgi:hypothetical protein